MEPNRPTDRAEHVAEPLAFCAYEVLKVLNEDPSRYSTVEELHEHPLLRRFSRGLVHNACRLLFTVGDAEVRVRYVNRPGRMPHEFAAACPQGGRVKSLEPGDARPSQPRSAHAGSKGVFGAP